MNTADIVLCSPVRTAIGAFNGSLKTRFCYSVPATLALSGELNGCLPSAISHYVLASIAVSCDALCASC
jgi:hypothetical protein